MNQALCRLARMFDCPSARVGWRLPLVLFLSIGGCSGLRDNGDNQSLDPGFEPGEAPAENAHGCRGRACSSDRACASGYRCVEGICFIDQGSCVDGNSCQNDTRCYQGACIPFAACSKLKPYDPSCMGEVFPHEEFKPPVVSCHLPGFESLSIPVIADLDRDGKPEAITLAFSDTILAMHTSTCTLMWKTQLPLLSGAQGGVAVADLDGDGFPEIVAQDDQDRVIVLDHLGKLLATADTPAQEHNPYGQQNWSAPAIADVDGVQPPEIIVGAQVSRFVAGPPAHIDVLWTRTNNTSYEGTLPIAADLDGDGRPEVITSDRIYDGLTGSDKTPPQLADKPFYAQVADFNLDKRPDLLLVESEKGRQVVSIYDYTNQKTIFGPYRVAEGGWGGPAVIADFDGDKVPDFGLASASHYYTYSLKCAASPRPADCQGSDPGVLWAKQTHDMSSGGTGSSVFDFNGDGIAEVVYRDECFLRVYSGQDGATLFAYPISSNTCLELPVIADADNDGHADIIVTSDDGGACMGVTEDADTHTPWTGKSSGIFILRDPLNRWRPSRPLWNQHSYHITNINDDLTVPKAETANWLTYNNYRQNVQPARPGSEDRPDPTSRPEPTLDTTDCSKLWRLRGSVCNRGAGGTPLPLYATFYDGNPEAGGQRICTAQATMSLGPGQCQNITCDWTNPPSGARDIYLRVGDDGKGGRLSMQCKTGNDLSILKNASCSGAPA